MRAVMIFNPTSGISTVTEKRMSPEETERTIVEGLRAYGIEPELMYTTPEDGGEGMAKRAAASGEKLIIAVGGDGTIHAVANALIGTRSVLGIVATGTMNNLAHSLNVPDTIPSACTAIAKGVTRSIDVGVINGHTFLEVAGIGLEAELFPLGEKFKSPGLFSTIQSVWNSFKTLLAYKPTRIRITTNEGKRRTYSALQVTICNAPYYGVHFHMASHILMDDGLLDVFIYRHFSKLEYLRHAAAISQGKRVYQPKLQRLRVRALCVTTSEPVAIQADGQPLGNTPAEITVLPGALRIRVSGNEAPGLHEKAERGAEQLISAPGTSQQRYAVGAIDTRKEP